jgi:arylsulfatase A-like enzyme
VKKYREKLSRKKSDQNPAYILEGNPDAKKPLQREELDSLINDKSYAGYSVLPNQTVKIKQRQDNVEFAAMVESMDESLGRVLAKLKELGIENNTLIIFYSDNGGMSAANFYYPARKIPQNELDKEFSSSNLPLRGAKGWMYEGGIRVPLIVKWPGKGQKGTLCDVPVTSPDFLPSILEIAGIPLTPEQHTDGVSFVPLLKGETKIDRDAIYWHFPHYSNHGMQSPGGAIRCGDYKLLEYYENNTVQLFNLKEDIGEMNDLSKSNPDKVSELRDKLHAWRDKISAKMMSPNPDYKSSLRIN